MSKKNQTLMSVKEYAQYRGCSIQAVYDAINSHRISTAAVPGKRTMRIDPAIADKEWKENSDPSSVIGGEALKRKSSETKEVDPEDYDDDIIDDKDHIPVLTVSKRRREHYNAEIAKLRFMEQDGRLVDAESVRKEYFKRGRIVREAMLNIPDRISPELASETDTHKVNLILTKAIRDALTELTDA